MTTPQDSGFQEAERRIEAARVSQATELDLSKLRLTVLPDSLSNLTRLNILWLQLLKATVPFAGPILGFAAHEMQERLSDDLDLTQKVLDSVPEQLLNPDDPLGGIKVGGRHAPASRAETDADFRVLRAMLLKQDPDQHWGGLSHLLTPEGLSLYLCREHLATYRTLAPQ